LGAAHARGIVHRDVKPENVLHDEAGRPLVADLGLGKHVGAAGAASIALSRTSAILGTASYMAPEQLEEARSVGPAADVFALGAVPQECLPGGPVFAGAAVHEVPAAIPAG